MSLFRILIFICCFILVSYGPVLAQLVNSKLKNDTTVNIHGDIGSEGREFNITILKSNGRIKITYIVNDSINKSAMERDEVYQRFHKLYDDGKLFSKKIKEKEASEYLNMFKRHQVNSTDSISFQEDSKSSFNKLVRTIAQNDLKELTDSNRISFDGFSVHIRVEASQKFQEISVHNPNVKLEPLLTALISQTVSIYRTFKNQNLLEKTYLKDY
jgi:hypothetical protein